MGIHKSTNHTSPLVRYLKYAIGEIALVVIGILIALSINNWNEHRRTSNNQDTYLILLKKETLNNIEELTKVKTRVNEMLKAQKKTCSYY
ncbi:DUF6090 family protein [Formosa agariphila]|uniref:DUF6090 family protein n=1 Tax=Formosa agariphila TaxID=320324 RepID=UPI00068F81A4|nr:DUF6090 family protein [Formosa agariphila]